MGLTFIASKTAPGDCNVTGEIRFVDGEDGVVFDNTYIEYQFYFVNVHPATQNVGLQFQVNDVDDPVASGGGFDASPIQSTYFVSYNNEAGSDANLGYSSSYDLANAADSYQTLIHNIDNEAFDSCSGILTIYDPSSATYVKHFIGRLQGTHHNAEYSMEARSAGYINDPTAIDEINFKFSSGNIDLGTIYMYGVS